MISHFVANSGLSKFITILHGGGVFPIYYNITMGGGGGVSQDPKFVLRNIWTASIILFGIIWTWDLSPVIITFE